MFDGEVMRCSKTTSPRARKHHSCCECLGTVEPGEVYERVDGMWANGSGSYVTCGECVDLRKKFIAKDPHRECPDFGCLHEAIECYCPELKEEETNG